MIIFLVISQKRQLTNKQSITNVQSLSFNYTMAHTMDPVIEVDENNDIVEIIRENRNLAISEYSTETLKLMYDLLHDDKCDVGGKNFYYIRTVPYNDVENLFDVFPDDLVVRDPSPELVKYPVFAQYTVNPRLGSFPALYYRIYNFDRSFMDDIIQRWDNKATRIMTEMYDSCLKDQYFKHRVTTQLFMGPRTLINDPLFINMNLVDTVICDDTLPLSTSFIGQQYKIPFPAHTEENNTEYNKIVKMTIDIIYNNIYRHGKSVLLCCNDYNNIRIASAYLVMLSIMERDGVIPKRRTDLSIYDRKP